MRISVIVVNYNTCELSIEAVDSVLARDHGENEVEVHLVDNASPGEDVKLFNERKASQDWKAVSLWPEKTNHGFGRGNNIVLNALAQSQTPPDFVFLLNPDAKLRNEAIEILVDEMAVNPLAGAIGAGILDPKSGERVTACFRFPTALGEIERVIGFGPISRLLDGFRSALPPDTPAGQVDWVAGCSVLLRFKAIQKLDFFDPDYFLYFEEVDLMRRMKDNGWQVVYQPRAIVEHAAGASTNVQSNAKDRRRRPAYVYRSWRRFFKKHHGRVYAVAAAIALQLGVALGLTIAVLRRRETSRQPLNFFSDNWKYVISPLLGLRKDADYGQD